MGNNAKLETVLVSLLLFAFATQAFVQILHISATYDEPITIATGYYQLISGDFRLNPTHPPLAPQLNALPLLFSKPQFPFEDEDCIAKRHWQCTEAFISANSEGIGRLLFLARLPHILIGMLLGLVVYFWSKSMYGKKAAVLSLVLFAFSPVLISFSGTTLQNIVVTFFIVLTSYLLWRFIRNPAMKLLVAVGISFGLGLAADFNSVLLLAVFAPFFVISLFLKKQTVYERLFSRQLRKPFLALFIYRVKCLAIIAAIVALCVSFVLLAFYHGQFTPLVDSVPPHYLDYVSENVYDKLDNIPVLGKGVPFAIEKVPVPFATFWSGFAWQYMQTTGTSKTNYFAGEVYTGANYLYFFANIFFKTPIPLLFMFLAGLLLLWRRRKRIIASGEWVLLLLPVVFLLFFIPSSRNAGPSHILSVYVFMIMIAGVSARFVFKSRRKLLGLAVALLVSWYVLGTLMTAPHYISYFNEFLPVENAYEVFSDSSNDMGQELKHLSAYMDENNIERVKLSYFGGINPSVYGITYEYLASPRFQAWIPNPSFDDAPVEEGCSPVQGLIAISITNLNGVHMSNRDCFGWLKQYTPIEIIGSSIFIYNITG